MDSVTSQAGDSVQLRRERRSRRDQALALAANRVQARICLPGSDQPVARPLLLAFCGLPGSGKSYLAQRVQPLLPATIVETDAVRHILVPHPCYSGAESAWVYAVSHYLIARLLGQRQSVIFDATNLLRRSRQSLYSLAEDAHAGLVIVYTSAPDAVIRQRLLKRSVRADANNHSDATIDVYNMLRRTEQPIRGPHLVIDTTEDCDQSIQRIVQACRDA